ncbi:hypothetical protein MMC22_003145 [Lobaria immixta]|nr:hypothetical protein [Lobaria immixta]
MADSPNWHNQTRTGRDSISVPFVSEAELVYLPMGSEGVLLLIGGIDNMNWKTIPLSRISVYDIQSKTWYEVMATGDFPEDRCQFCAVVSASVDQSTFQVTIFGGQDWINAAKRYEDVFVLTVPSFRWIKVHDKNDVEDPRDSIGRTAHRCVIYNDAQMIVLGGSAEWGTNSTSCNTAYPPLRVLDTSSYIWRNVFDPSIEYRVPDIVTNVIGGNATGNANLTEPEGGWNFTALQTIFSQRIPNSQTAVTTASASTKTSVSTATSPSNADPSASDNKLSPNEPKKNTGAIVGGVVAGVVVLIAALLLYRTRASKARRQDQSRDEGTRVGLPERNSVQVFQVPNELSELGPGNRFVLSENSVKLPISRFELQGS